MGRLCLVDCGGVQVLGSGPGPLRLVGSGLGQVLAYGAFRRHRIPVD